VVEDLSHVAKVHRLVCEERVKVALELEIGGCSGEAEGFREP
jgi:hypothetical protein